MSRRRFALVICVVGLVAAGVLLSWSWLRPVVLEPLVLVLWLAFRLFVLSVPQVVWWLGLLAVAAAALVALLRRGALLFSQPEQPLPALLPADPVEVWERRLRRLTSEDSAPLDIGWDGLRQLVLSLRSLELRVPADYRLHDALRDGRAALPARVHAYLFPAAPARAGSVRQLTSRIAGIWCELSGRGRAQRLADVSELLTYLEDALEMPHHDPDR